eukprot:6182504-Pleurochrysis_carterae.AAC.2
MSNGQKVIFVAMAPMMYEYTSLGPTANSTLCRFDILYDQTFARNISRGGESNISKIFARFAKMNHVPKLPKQGPNTTFASRSSRIFLCIYQYNKHCSKG